MKRIKIIKFWNRGKDGYCVRCGHKLTEAEKTYYGNSCDRCEGIFMKMINKE